MYKIFYNGKSGVFRCLAINSAHLAARRVTKILKPIYIQNACYKILEPDEEKQKEKINNHLKAFAAYPSL